MVTLLSQRSFWPAPTEVDYLVLFPLRSLAQVQSSGGGWLRPASVEIAPVEVAHFGLVLCSLPALVLLWKRSLAQACSGKDHWFEPAPTVVPGSGLLLLRSLT